MRLFPVVVLFLLLVEIHAGLATLTDEAEFELVEVLRTEFKFAWVVLAAFYTALNGTR